MTVDLTQTEGYDKLMNHLARVGIATGPASYTTGGDLTANEALFRLGRIDVALFEPFTNGTNILLARWLPASHAVQFWDPSTKAEVGAATALNGYTARFLVLGKG